MGTNAGEEQITASCPVRTPAGLGAKDVIERSLVVARRGRNETLNYLLPSNQPQPFILISLASRHDPRLATAGFLLSFWSVFESGCLFPPPE
jgi:hypothetical protein